MKGREKVLFYVIGALVGFWLIGRVVFAPFHARLAGLSRDLTLQEARLKKGFSLVERREEISSEYDKYASYFSLANLSDEEAAANFLKEIEKISRESGLAIQDMKPQKEVETDKFSKQYTINIKAESTMEQLVDFLYGLSSSKFLLGIEKITLSPKKEDSPELSMNISIFGVTFLE